MADASAQDLNGILAQLFRVGPTDDEKKQAFAQALTRGGLGILAANQPSRMPTNPGATLAQGALGGLDAYQATLDKAQSDRKADAGAALQGLAIKKQMDQQAALAGLLKDDPAAPAASAAAGGSQQFPAGGPWAPNMPVGQPTAPSGPSLPPGYKDIPLGKLQALAAGGYDPSAFLKIREAAQPKLENVKGIGMVHPTTGQVVTSMPTISDNGMTSGLVPDGKGGWKVQVPEGSLGAYQGFKNADEAAKARFDPFLGQIDSQGRPIPQTRLQFAGGVDPIAAAAAGATQPKAGMGPTPVQASAQREIGQSDAQRVASLEQKIPSLVSMQRRLSRMSALTADDATYAAAGAEIKSNLGSVAQAFGLKVNAAKTANTEEYIAHVAELLKDRLASKDYGSGSGVSNLDLISASKPLPDLAKTPQGRQQIIQAIGADTQRSLNDAMAAREHFGQNMSLRGFRYPSELERPPLPRGQGTPPSGTGGWSIVR